MKIKVKFFAYFRDLFGEREKEIRLPEGAHLRQLLEILGDSPERRSQIFMEEEKLNAQTIIIKNAAPVQSSGGLDAPLADGDVIAVFPYLGGG
jgi:molybdopterin synthase sulfur carrier subunit